MSNHFISFSTYLFETALYQKACHRFGQNIVFNKKHTLTTKYACEIFNFLNIEIFNSKLQMIPIKCISYDAIIQILKARSQTSLPKNAFVGLYSVLLQNSIANLNMSSELNFSNDIILMNKTYLNNVSFAFAVSSICHEMIHYYDKCFGEYSNMIKTELLYNVVINPHTTPTFKDKMKIANDKKLSVITDIDINNIKQYDYEAFQQITSSLTENDKQPFKNNEHISIIDDNTLIINTF